MKILIISTDPVAKKMAGLGIRNYYIAKELVKKIPDVKVTLAVPNEIDLNEELFEIVRYKNSLAKLSLILKNDLIISQGFGLVGLLGYFLPGKKFLLDLYDPINLEWLETGSTKNKNIYAGRNKFNKDYLNLELQLADFIVCANTRQRDMWIGQLLSLGLITTDIYLKDKTLKTIIDTAGFGVRDDAVVRGKPVLKGIVDGIKKTDKVLLWNGGVWNWFDPLTLIEAINKLSKKRDDIKLYFIGSKHPNPKVKELEMLNEALALAKKHQLLDRVVYFNSDWLDFEATKAFLLEADVGVATYFDNLETRFSHRSRFFDLLWAELPMILTSGDFLSELVEIEKLGLVVTEKNSEKLAEAIEILLDNNDFYERSKQNIRRVKESFSWSQSLSSLVNFSSNPNFIKKRTKLNFLYLINLFTFYFRWLALQIFKIY